MMTFSSPLAQSEYSDLRFSILRQLEGSEVEVYIDSKNRPAMGIGFDLRSTSTLDRILSVFGFDPNDPTDSQFRQDIITIVNRAFSTSSNPSAPSPELLQLWQDLDAVMLNRSVLKGGRNQFEFAGDAEIKSVFDTIIPSYEAQAKNRAGIGASADNTRELAVLTSLEYNSKSPNFLIGPSLKDALATGDRTEAWFEIRYRSNNEQQGGIAKRRMVESQIFGLYDNNTEPSRVEEALLAFRTMTKHEQWIVSYEQSFGGQIGNAQNDLTAIEARTPQADDFGSIQLAAQSLRSAPPGVDSAFRLLEREFADFSTLFPTVISNLQSVGYAGALLSPQITQIWIAAPDQGPQRSGASAEVSAHTVDRTGKSDNDLIFGNIDSGPGVSVTNTGGADTLKGGGGNDIFIGGDGGDDMDGGDGEDTVSYANSTAAVTVNLSGVPYNGNISSSGGQAQGDSFQNIENVIGSEYNDEFIVAGGNHVLIGLGQTSGPDGRDTARFIGSAEPIRVRPGDQIVEDASGGITYLIGIERIIGTRRADIIEFDEFAPTQFAQIESIDLQGQDEEVAIAVSNDEGPQGDEVDASGVSGAIFADFRHAGNQVVALKNERDVVLHIKNAESIRTGSGNDLIYGGYTTDEVDTGAGNDVVFSFGIDGDIVLGSGDDILLNAGLGAVVHGGEGNDRFSLSKNVLIADAEANDSFWLMNLLPLDGGLRNASSESSWAIGNGGIRYGLTVDGNLVVRDLLGRVTTIANYVGGPGAPTNTAGIYVGEFDIDIYNLLDPDLPGGSVTSQLEFVCAELKILLGAENVNDPLVLDLDGDGIELTARTGVSPLFDVDGDLFAEPTGWVRGDDGMLALDANANGTIDSVRELFGGPGASGFAELATYDGNSDGIINGLDAIFGDLRVWQDLDGDAVTDAGELKTLAELAIVSINVTGTAQSGVTNAGNTVLATGTFTRANGSTGTLADIGLSADQIHTDYLGDKSISTAAAALPELKGRGTLTDLRVAMTLDPNLITTVQNTLPGLNTLELEALRAAALPILAGWAQAVKLPDASGTLVTVPPATHADLPVLVEYDSKGRPHVTDFAYQATDAQGSYWALASGDPIRDANGAPIARPVYQDVLDQTGAWTLFTGAEIAFMERYTGVDLPIDTVTSVPVGGLDAMSSIVDNLFTALNRLTIRLAIQGPLADYFDGIAYDVEADNFHATTDRQLIPVYEAIFADAPATAQGAADYLADWKPLLDYLLGDFDRGADHLEVTYSYVFAAMVAAYESTGLATDITTAAGALGVPTDLIVTGTGTLTGSNDADIFYMGAGDQVAHGGIGLDLIADDFELRRAA